jgi:uncharacterized surface protein with fasciclin (FAS1) repeats
VTACGDDEILEPEDNSIVGTALEAGNFSTLLTALDEAGLTNTLQGGSYTVFAPTDAAFDALPAGALDGLLADTDALTEVLTYHVVQGEYSAAQLEALSSIETLQGQPIVITQGSVVLNGVTVSQSVSADNGIIHVIDEVLLPPEEDIVEKAVSAGFSTLATALTAANLIDALKAVGPFTVFAPTDAAFAALPEGTLDALLADPEALAEVLTYHVVSGRVYARDLDGVVSSSTLAGYPVLFDLSDGAKINNSNITSTDILTTNGVIHVIDEVLLPPTGDIVEIAVAGGFNTLATALTEASLVEALQAEGPFTVFAPTDAAFAALPDGVLDNLLADTEALTDVLLYHVVSGQIFSGDLSDGQTAETLQGQSITVDLSDGVMIDDASVTSADIIATNGVIHVIDEVLLLDIIQQALSNDDFSTLVTAVQAAGLVETLRGDGPFTVFAPTNEAFAALPEGALSALLADTDALTEVLLYHVIADEIYAADLTDDAEVATVQGQSITVDLTEGARIDDANVTGTDIASRNGVIHVIDGVLLLDIVQKVLSDDSFSTLATAVAEAGLVEALRGDGPFTVFAPTNDAFDALPEGALTALLADTDALTEVLLYHVLSGSVFAGDLPGVVSGQTLAGYPVLFDLSDGAKINGSNITVTDIYTRNGVIHVIDAVLLPPEGDIVETAVAAGFSTLAAALEAGDLVSALQAEGPFTVFAPTNAAFEALPEGVLDDLLLPENQSQLQNILLYHVVSGQIFSGNLEDGATPTTLQGQTLTVDLSEGVMINDANVTSADIITKNGVIHVIDAVLIPESD